MSCASFTKRRVFIITDPNAIKYLNKPTLVVIQIQTIEII